MNCWTRQVLNERPAEMDCLEMCSKGGFWEPMVVETQKEKDYLLGLSLVLGVPFEVCLDGIDKPKRDTPPTWVHIPELSQ